MHRSGTSFVAGAFARSGYYVGSDDKVLPPGPDNRPGYFERIDVVDLDDRMLGSLGASWWMPPPAEAVLAGQARFVGAAADLLAMVRAEAGDRPVVLKDPRMACLMPIWDAVVASRFVDVLVLRNPIDTARSLARRNGLPVQYSLALWEVHLCGLLRSLAGRPVVTVNFGAIAGDHGATKLTAALAGVFGRLGIAPPDFESFAATERHFSGLDSDLLSVATPSQLGLWRYLTDVLLFEPQLMVPAELTMPSEAATNLIDEVGRLLDPLNPEDQVDAPAVSRAGRVRLSPAPRGLEPGPGIDGGERLASTLESLASTVEAWRAAETRESDLRAALSMAHRSAAVAHEQLLGLLERAAGDSVARASDLRELTRLDRALSEQRLLAESLSAQLSSQRAEFEAFRAKNAATKGRLRELLQAERDAHSSATEELNAARQLADGLRVELTELDAAWVRRTEQMEIEFAAGRQTVLVEASRRVAAAEEALRCSDTARAEAEAELAQVFSEFQAVIGSRSWSLTRPLRWIMYLARGRRARRTQL
jgi:hypothetical protein